MAAMMVRGSFLKAMRYFDESYGAYGSELDLCWQLRHAQKKIVIVREARAVHYALPSPVKAESSPATAPTVRQLFSTSVMEPVQDCFSG